MLWVYCPFSKNDNFLILEDSFIWPSNLAFSFSKNFIWASGSLFDESISSTFGFALFFQYQTFVLKEASLADLCFEDFIKEELIFFNQATVKRGYFNQRAYFDQIQIL